MPVLNPKNVLVVGGGPGGMEAARTAASRGHRVTLVEKNEKLGGHLIEAGVPDYKYLIKEYAAWLERQVRNAGVEIRNGVEATPSLVKKMKLDAIILAHGAKTFIPDVPGVEKENVVHALDVLVGNAEVGAKVVIIGGELVAAETAYCLAKEGKKIDIVEVRPEILSDVSDLNKHTMMNELLQYGVTSHVNWELSEIIDNGVIARNADGEEKAIGADTVVIATGFVSDDNLYTSLKDLTEEIYQIGDSVKPRKIYDAVHEGYLVGKEI